MREVYRTLATISPPRDRGALLVVLEAAARAGVIPRDLGNWLKAIVELPDLRLRNAMVPRVDVVAIPEESSVTDAARLMAEHGRRRLPVFRGTIDQPTGILHALDVAHALATNPAGQANPPPTAGRLARPALSLSDALPLLDAIRAMQAQAAHLVLVMDEHGGLAGLATLEDLLEQLLGPIPDEYGDEGRDAIRVIGDGVAIVGAAAGLHEIERALDVRIPDGPFVSIGGFVYDRLGRVPQPGDIVELPGIRIDVLSVDGVRLRDLRVRAGIGLSANVSLPDSAYGAPTSLNRRLELRLGREVVCGTDVVGSLERLVVESASGRVSHIVVRRGGRVLVVPLELVEREDDGVLHLRPTACDLDRFPTDELDALSRSTEVVCTDGAAGRVRCVLVDRLSGAVTHVVVRVSVGLLAPRELVVPLSWARSFTPERIELAASRDELVGLPEFRPDDDIAIEMLRRLDESPVFQGINRYTARVDVDGGVVRLSGRVRSAELRQAAEDVAVGVRGVLSVDNQLVADDVLAASVVQALQANGAHVDELEVSVLLGQVKLRGRVATAQDRRAAAEVARAVPGVESVVNELWLQASRMHTGST